MMWIREGLQKFVLIRVSPKGSSEDSIRRGSLDLRIEERIVGKMNDLNAVEEKKR